MRRRKPLVELPPKTLTCRIFDHDWVFETQGPRMVWWCRRGCGEGGERIYDTPQEARRYARAFNGNERTTGRVLAMLGGTLLRRQKTSRD